MTRPALSLAFPLMAILAIGMAVAGEGETVPLYTGEDLDRMFGPPPPGPSVPVDKSRPEDWNTVERFLDREYARIDAERQHELNLREYEQASARDDGSSRIYGSMLWGGYFGGYYGGYYGGGYDRGRGNDCRPRDYTLRGSGISTSRAAIARATGGGRHNDRGAVNGGGHARGGSPRGGHGRGTRSR